MRLACGSVARPAVVRVTRRPLLNEGGGRRVRFLGATYGAPSAVKEGSRGRVLLVFIEAEAGEREPQPPFGGAVTESHTKLVSKPFNSRNGGLIFPIEKIAGQTEKYVEPAQSFAKSGRARGAGGSGAWGLRRLISHPRACHTSCQGRLGRRRRRLTHSGRRWGAERRSPMAPSRATAGESVPCTRR